MGVQDRESTKRVVNGGLHPLQSALKNRLFLFSSKRIRFEINFRTKVCYTASQLTARAAQLMMFVFLPCISTQENSYLTFSTKLILMLGLR